MEQEVIITIQLVFFIVIAITALIMLIICLRCDNNELDCNKFEKYDQIMREQTIENLDILSKMNKQKNKLEEKIRKKKKKLGIKLVD